MGWEKCSWCGQSFYKKPGFFSADAEMLESAADVMGAGILVKMGKGIAKIATKQFCSKQCKLAYENSKNESAGENSDAMSSSSGVKEDFKKMGSEMLGSIASSFTADGIEKEYQAKEQEKIDERAEFIQKDEECEKIALLQLGDTGEEIEANLQQLISSVAALKKGIFASEDEKRKRIMIKTKIAYGILRLQVLGCNDDAEYFQKKLNDIK